MHIAVNPDSGGILAEELTHLDVHDTVPVPAMLGRIAGRLGRVYGDGAYAGGPTHRTVAEHRQALPNAEGVFRPRAPDVRAAATLDPLTGRGRHARHVSRDGCAAWERATAYGRRNAAEWTFSRLERVFGAGLRSRSLDGQRAEAGIAVSLDATQVMGRRHRARSRRSVQRRPVPGRLTFGFDQGGRPRLTVSGSVSPPATAPARPSMVSPPSAPTGPVSAPTEAPVAAPVEDGPGSPDR